MPPNDTGLSPNLTAHIAPLVAGITGQLLDLILKIIFVILFSKFHFFASITVQTLILALAFAKVVSK